MAILLVSEGVVLNPEWGADRQRARDRVVKLRAEAIEHDRRGMVLFANECRRRARMQENLFDLDPMGAVADALRDQAEARAEDEVLKQQEHMCNCVPDEECCGGESDE